MSPWHCWKPRRIHLNIITHTYMHTHSLLWLFYGTDQGAHSRYTGSRKNASVNGIKWEYWQTVTGWKTVFDEAAVSRSAPLPHRSAPHPLVSCSRPHRITQRNSIHDTSTFWPVTWLNNSWCMYTCVNTRGRSVVSNQTQLLCTNRKWWRVTNVCFAHLT